MGTWQQVARAMPRSFLFAASDRVALANCGNQLAGPQQLLCFKGRDEEDKAEASAGLPCTSRAGGCGNLLPLRYPQATGSRWPIEVTSWPVLSSCCALIYQGEEDKAQSSLAASYPVVLVVAMLYS